MWRSYCGIQREHERYQLIYSSLFAQNPAFISDAAAIIPKMFQFNKGCNSHTVNFKDSRNFAF